MNPDLKGRLIGWLSGSQSRRTAVVAAHPDDETVGLGARLRELRDTSYVIVTGGAPLDMQDARTHGFTSGREYARARARELRAVLSLCGIDEQRVLQLGFVDQRVSFGLIELVECLAAIFSDLRPEAVITHPYEGGHPDHDATAFAVHAAGGLLQARGMAAPLMVEMTSYHARAGRLEVGSFLRRPGSDPLTFRLTPEERGWKQRLIDCYQTQRETLSMFPLETECFRVAPRYDFTCPAHPPPLFYDWFDWGIGSAEWLRRVRAARRVLRDAWH